ncbi:PLP-dependent transferase [Telmatospirillum sp.]|uniref:PLP-dependent transferase n=1 Tax=Telmatospirillum sp. TaxID=2079197 RepID=UPI00284B5565|nr:PLP-dependent transferase [Telmatospirillum sp.]MDR3437409.1 PLP-dependent transferase [Telmatospirillum sp.]
MTSTEHPIHPETLALHGGSFRADPATGAVAVPIYQTTSYQFHDTGHAERMFSLREVGFTYTRTGNPTRDAAERRLAALEGGAGSLIVASGTAARLYSLVNLAQAGDNLVVAANVFEASELKINLARHGIDVRFVDPGDPTNFRNATDSSTRAYFGETLGLADLRLFPIAEVAAIGRKQGIPLIVDNSALPVQIRPLDQGAAVVVYATPAYLSGHGITEAGALIDGGTFPWADHAKRCPLLTEPDDSYHGAVWTDVAAWFKVPLAYLIRARMRVLRDFGGAVSPFDVFQLIQGLETLPLRMRAHAEGARAIATYLSGRDDVESVLYPKLAGDDVRSGLVKFRHRGGRDAALKILAAFRLIRRGDGFGETRSVADLGRDPANASITLSVGIEHPEDLIADLEQALDTGA